MGKKNEAKKAKGSVCFFYGDGLKSGYAYFAASADSKPEQLYEEMKEYYGCYVTCKYVTVEDHESYLTKFKKSMKKVHHFGNVYLTHVNNAITELKSVTGEDRAHSLHEKPPRAETKETSDTKKTKSTKNKKAEEDEDDEEHNEPDDEAEDTDNDEDDNNDEDKDEDEDEEEEDVPVVKSSKSKKSTSSNKKKNTKQDVPSDVETVTKVNKKDKKTKKSVKSK